MTTETYEVAQLLDTIASLEATVAKLRAQLELDTMTGLMNHAAGDAKLNGMCNAAGRRGVDSFSIVIIDIDHFKAVNDTYGHAVGDVVIKSLAEVILENIRVRSEVGLVDYAVRWGGEEMVLLLQNTDSNQAYEVAERISQDFKSITFEPGFTKTISVGIAAYAPYEYSKELFERADAALYTSKTSGRDQITISVSPR